MATLELRDITMVYPSGGAAVDHVDLSVDDGELFVLVGPSGAGKTTLLRIVAGLETPTSGDVLIDGERVNDLTPQQRNIAMAFQHYALYPHLTAAENIGFALKVSGAAKALIDERVLRVARLLDLEDVLERRPRTLSGGQRQRVALGRAIIRQPRLFLMDEPLSNLDTKRRIEARSEIVAVQRRLRSTTLHVTHDQREAMAMADRLAVMAAGRLLQLGTPNEVYERPVNLFVAQFLGIPAMSVVRAVVCLDNEDVAVDAGRWQVTLPRDFIAARPTIKALAGRPVGFGFRSESLHPDPYGPILADVTSTEVLGADQLIHATVAGTPVGHQPPGNEDAVPGRAAVAVLVDAHDRIDRWQPLRLRLDTDEVYFFDLETGDALPR